MLPSTPPEIPISAPNRREKLFARRE